MLTNAHGLLLGSRGRTAQEPSCLSSSSKYSERLNTMRFLMHVLFWPCTTRQAKAGLSFLTVTLRVLQELFAPWVDNSDYRRSAVIKNWKTKSKRETGKEKHPQRFKVQKVSLVGADKALLQLCKIQKPGCYVLLGWERFCLFSF